MESLFFQRLLSLSVKKKPYISRKGKKHDDPIRLIKTLVRLIRCSLPKWDAFSFFFALSLRISKLWLNQKKLPSRWRMDRRSDGLGNDSLAESVEWLSTFGMHKPSQAFFFFIQKFFCIMKFFWQSVVKSTKRSFFALSLYFWPFFRSQAARIKGKRSKKNWRKLYEEERKRRRRKCSFFGRKNRNGEKMAQSQARKQR